MIELYVLNELAAFPKYGTLTAVAEKMNVSQPALSRSMKKLEEDLGVQLFERGKNRIVLNENGKIAAEYAQKVIEAESVFEKKVIEYEQTHRIFSFASIAPMPISELTPILSQQFMGMTIKHELKDNEKELYKSLDSGKSKLVVTLSSAKEHGKIRGGKTVRGAPFIRHAEKSPSCGQNSNQPERPCRRKNLHLQQNRILVQDNETPDSER